jgi:hypothetical protein
VLATCGAVLIATSAWSPAPYFASHVSKSAHWWSPDVTMYDPVSGPVVTDQIVQVQGSPAWRCQSMCFFRPASYWATLPGAAFCRCTSMTVKGAACWAIAADATNKAQTLENAIRLIRTNTSGAETTSGCSPAELRVWIDGNRNGAIASTGNAVST